MSGIMLSKVTHRVTRRRTLLKTPKQEQRLHQRVDVAPELLRWSDFSTPFPSVSVGGYTRFYTTYTIPESTEPINFSPLLSQYPEPSPSSEIPLKSPLFATLRRRCLPVIQEVSPESLAQDKPRNLTISTTPSHSLKRRRGRLLRTPSIERDFGNGRCQSPSDTSVIVSELEAPSSSSSSSTSSTDIAPSPICSTSSSDSQEPSDSSSHSDSPITPSTSIDSHDDSERSTAPDKISPQNEAELATERPISTTSFRTAHTAFSEI